MKNGWIRQNKCVWQIWICASVATIFTYVYAGELKVEQYRLSEKTYSSVPLASVYDGFVDYDYWRNETYRNNPKISAKIQSEKLATLDVKMAYKEDLGSIDPFLLEARKSAAALGSNLLALVNAALMKENLRYTSVTFTAYRVTDGNTILPPSTLQNLATVSLESKPLSSFLEDLPEGMLVKLKMKNGVVVSGPFVRINNEYLYLRDGAGLFEKAYKMPDVEKVDLPDTRKTWP